MTLLIVSRSWLLRVNSMRNLMSKSHRCLRITLKSIAMMICSRYVLIPPQFLSYIDLISASPKTTRIRQLPISTFFDPNPFPSHESDALPETETLVEDIAPAQPTSDGLIVKFWYPSQMGTGPISHDSDALLLRISKMTKTQITVEGARGLRISAQYMNNIDEAIDILDCLEECLVQSRVLVSKSCMLILSRISLRTQTED